MEDENEVVIVTNVYGDFCVRKARRKRQKLLVQELMLDYANNTTLHGLPYITRKRVTLVEKVFWVLTFIASMSICLYQISKVWDKWQTSPVIVTVSEHLVPVGKVPFPSVTICPQSKCMPRKYNYTAKTQRINALLRNENITSIMNDTLREELIMYEDVSRICGLLPFEFQSLAPEMYENYFSNASVVDHINKVAPPLMSFVDGCKVRGEYVNCHELLNEVLTKEGICYNMNSLSADEILRNENLQQEYEYLHAYQNISGWSITDGYTPHLDNYYPLPGSENGESPDVEIKLVNYDPYRDKLCNSIKSGFKVYIHHPADLPQSSLYYYAVLQNQVSSMALSLSYINTSDSLRRYDAVTRQCYFSDEKYLKYFKIYTASNCKIECLSNKTFEICKCVEFYMPHFNSSTICTARDATCVSDAQAQVLEEESDVERAICKCLPSCTGAIDYEAEILKTNYHLLESIKEQSKINVNEYYFYDEEIYSKLNFSKLEMYFKKSRFVSMRRSELFGVTDFLANCGGLLGLFLGFSFLSLVEIFYFLTLRLCCTLKKDLEEEKATAVMEKQQDHIKKY
ncbi:unnamed protein product [Chrysodeixis includens]|uniref:Uncharacterized protein n=1 Tax=Chrysodeixis includens TaxID=689277 RepID=A0A9N8KR50_CHRIL|nr:unnamed protein product [Chrysodeixis includens]